MSISGIAPLTLLISLPGLSFFAIPLADMPYKRADYYDRDN
jgi:hypothetical protein